MMAGNLASVSCAVNDGGGRERAGHLVGLEARMVDGPGLDSGRSVSTVSATAVRLRRDATASMSEFRGQYAYSSPERRSSSTRTRCSGVSSENGSPRRLKPPVKLGGRFSRKAWRPSVPSVVA